MISEIHKATPDSAVIHVFEQIGSEASFLSVVTIGELTRGLTLLPPGRRKTSVSTWIEEVEHSFADRILSIDSDVARTWGSLTANLRLRGIQLPSADGLIAATALTHRLAVVTRNVKDFQATGVDLINPWET